nr:hypothetical protein [Staphylococcus hominis]
MFELEFEVIIVSDKFFYVMDEEIGGYEGEFEYGFDYEIVVDVEGI